MVFEIFETAYVSQTMRNFENFLDAITISVFPQKSYKRQKNYLHDGLHKDRAIPIKTWVGCILDLNDYFKEFLKVIGLNLDRLDENEILGI